jgi:crotonobetainyl-CoA:carnitine CoA-transferase CaiB-like acyl-CoA transferase
VSGPLDGIRVLDLSRFIAGPLCAQLLGDMGGEVIKVERPRGEDARHHAPFIQDESMYVMMYNRNKLGVTLDSRHPDAKQLLERLILRSDVLVENYRPRTLAAMGFGYDRIHELNPRMVITSVSGFGQTGPESSRALFDAIAQAMSGLMSVTGAADSEPTLTGVFIADHIAAYVAALGTMFALFARERTGIGQIVDVASLDALVSCLGTLPSAYATLNAAPQRNGSRDALTAPANVFRAADGHVYIHAGTDPLWPRLCVAMGRPELGQDPDYATVPDRMRRIDELEKIVARWVATLTIADASKVLADAGIPFGPVATIPEIVASPQLRAREMFVEVLHSKVGPVTLLGLPIKLSATPGAISKAPPTVGEDNAAVYGEMLGLSPEEIGELHDSGAI